ncbi:hypothetical protein [Citrobacter phage vB_CfrS_K1M]
MNLKMKSGGKIIIDGREFTGGNIQINGDEVIIDGVKQSGSLIGDVNIQVFGDIESLENTRGTINVSGSSGDIKTVSGNVNVSGNSANVNTVSGSVTSKICGNVKTISGSINHK